MNAQQAALTTASQVTWSDGTPFNGYVLLILAMPSTGGSDWAKVALRDTGRRLPTRIKVPVIEGVIDSSTKVWFTSGYIPPSTRYSSFWYDLTDRLVAVGSSLFTIAADPYTLSVPVLTAPTAPSVSPAPQDVPSTQTANFFFGAPGRESLVGSKNGVNTTFTISRAASVVQVVWNGMLLDEGVGYTRVGTTLTLMTPPASDDTLEAFLW